MKVQVEFKGFTPVPDLLVQKFGLVTAAVYGAVWRYCQMENGLCDASFEQIGKRVKVSRSTVIRHLQLLCEHGYLRDTTPDLKHARHKYAYTGKLKLEGMVQAQQQVVEVGAEETPEGVQELHSSADRSDRESPLGVQELHSSADRSVRETPLGVSERHPSTGRSVRETPLGVSERHTKIHDQDTHATTTTNARVRAREYTPEQAHDMREEAARLYSRYFGSLTDEFKGRDFDDVVGRHGPAAVIEAIKVAVVERANGEKRTWGYVKSILASERSDDVDPGTEKEIGAGQSGAAGAAKGAGRRGGAKTDRRSGGPRGEHGGDGLDELLAGTEGGKANRELLARVFDERPAMENVQRRMAPGSENGDEEDPEVV